MDQDLIDSITGKVSVEKITIVQEDFTMKVGESTQLTAKVLPEDATDKTVIWSSSNEAVVMVSSSGKAKAEGPGEATITAKAGGKTEPYYESGYAQSTSPVWKSQKTGYSWASYKWCNGSSSTLTKYNTSSSYGSNVDNKRVLEADDDVAHVRLGGNWRMPTDAEWTELRNTDNCTWTWTSLNGINGRLVTSKKNGASIFLPAAGNWGGTDLGGVGSYGSYWSSSLDTGNRAYRVYFNSDLVDRNYYGLRYLGPSVRPVSE